MRHFALLALLLLAACVPKYQPYQPSPDGQPRFEEGRFHLPDTTPLPYRVWEPEAKKYRKKPKAVIVALHGFNDYSNAFEEPGKFMSRHGMVVYAYDQRGFGEAPHTGIWAGEENLVHDLKHFVQSVAARHPGAPIYLLGESMGGAVAISAVSNPDFPKIDGLILAAPAVWGEETMNPIYRFTLWLAAYTVPYYELTGSDLKILASNNIPMLRRMSYDPLIIKSTRVDAIYGIVNLMDAAYENVPNVKVPVLMLYGSEDQVIPPEPIKGALKRFSQPVRYVYYPGSYHMLLRDLQGETILKDIASWIRNPDAPLPSGIDRPKAAVVKADKN